MNISMNDRYEMNAALDRMVDDGDLFLIDDAALLIAKTPLTKRSRFNLTIDHGNQNNSTEGFAAGHGNVRIDQDDKEKVKTYGASEVARIGGYKLSHYPGRLLIKLMWSDLNPDVVRDGDRALLRYDRLTKKPSNLSLSHYRTVTVPFWPMPRLEFRYINAGWTEWKRPG